MEENICDDRQTFLVIHGACCRVHRLYADRPELRIIEGKQHLFANCFRSDDSWAGEWTLFGVGYQDYSMDKAL